MDNKDYKSCLMVSFKIPNWSFYLGNLIEPMDVYEEQNELKKFDKGIQLDSPHCTLLYGIYNLVTINDLLPHLLPLQSIPVKFKDINIFENEKFDVVKVEVESIQLQQMYSNLTKNIPYKNEYDIYIPHLTIGYVKKGKGKKYIRTNNKPFILYPESYWFTNSIKNIDEHFEIYD